MTQQQSTPRLIAIDTALTTVVAAHASAPGTRFTEVIELGSDESIKHAENIGPLIAEVLDLCGATPSDIQGVVYGVGPGLFTGLRVGIAAAQAFALGRGIPLYPVHSPEAVALTALEGTHAAHGRVRIIQDARRRELFVTEYAGIDEDGLPRLVDGPRVIERNGFAEKEWDIWPERLSAAGLIRIAERRVQRGRPFADPGALYLRQPDVRPPAATKRVVP